MFNRFASFLICVLLAPGMAQATISDLSCDDSARLTQKLTQVIGAERQATGLRDPETMLEVWVTRRNGDWMLVQTYANGTSCIVAMGAHWENTLNGPA